MVYKSNSVSSKEQRYQKLADEESKAHVAYIEGNTVVVENKKGEVLDSTTLQSIDPTKDDMTNPELYTRIEVGKKFYAYRVGNTAIIEDNNGKVIQRQKINKWDSPVHKRSRGCGTGYKKMLPKVLGLLGKSKASKK